MHDSNRPHLVECVGILLALALLVGFGATYCRYDSALSVAEERGAVLEIECLKWQAEHVRRGIAGPHGGDVETFVDAGSDDLMVGG